MTILPIQEGTAVHDFGQQGSVNVEVPKNAVSGETTFKIHMSVANANQRLDTSDGAFMVGDRIFHIEATDINKNNVTDFDKNLTISFTLPELPADVSGLGVYWFNSAEGEWILVPGAIFDPAIGKTTITVKHLTAFSIINGDGADEIVVTKEPRQEQTEAKNNKKNDDEIVVLDNMDYKDGALLRGTDKKVYVIKNGARQHIKTLAQLRQYAGTPIIDVDENTLNQYDGSNTNEESQLIRDQKHRIYLIENNTRLHIKTMAQLRQYAGQPITDVADDVVEQYAEVSVLGIQKFGDGVLIRGGDMKVYVIKNGKKSHIASLNELRKYAGQLINNVDDDILAQY
ncbi:MAG: hypothetical protein U9Q85_01925 [Patescibacteria group bacterium]|nr:hypothetical protein [Patescibacteria group bacterium]